MKISADWSGLRRNRWHDYMLRFALGGAITVMTGLVGKEFGPVIGGLFLAFPAIFPASATLLEKHETEKKFKAGIDGRKRGRRAAALDAAGAVPGAIGLAALACVAWQELPGHRASLVLLGAAFVWACVSMVLWWLRKHHRVNRPAAEAPPA